MDQGAKWEWHVSASIKEATVDQIWPFLIDFFNIHKWFPGLPTCYGIHGNNGEVGSIRYCSGFSLPSLDGTVSWSTEKLTAIDPKERMIRYEIIGCNTGFQNYVATVKISDGTADVGCLLKWFVAVDSIKGRKLEEIVCKYEAGLKIMAKNMEDDALRGLGKSD